MTIDDLIAKYQQEAKELRDDRMTSMSEGVSNWRIAEYLEKTVIVDLKNLRN